MGGGVRVKRILGVVDIEGYSLGLYVEPKGAIAELSGQWQGKTSQELAKSQEFYNALINGRFHKTFRLVTLRDISGKLMTDGLLETIPPRLTEKAKQQILPRLLKMFTGELSKGTEILFECSPDGTFRLLIAGKEISHFRSKEMLKVVCAIYMDENPISPSAKAGFATGFPALFASNADGGRPPSVAPSDLLSTPRSASFSSSTNPLLASSGSFSMPATPATPSVPASALQSLHNSGIFASSTDIPVTPTPALSLVAPSVVAGSGVYMYFSIGPSYDRWGTRFFRLVGTQLHYFVSHEDAERGVAPRGTVEITDSSVSEDFSETGRYFTFVLSDPRTRTACKLSTADIAQGKALLHALQNVRAEVVAASQGRPDESDSFLNRAQTPSLYAGASLAAAVPAVNMVPVWTPTPLLEPTSGKTFEATLRNGDSLFGVGLRVVGLVVYDLNIYSFGFYMPANETYAHIKKFAGRTGESLKTDQSFFDALIDAPVRKSFVLNTLRQLSASQVMQGLADNTIPRVGKDSIEATQILPALQKKVTGSLVTGSKVVVSLNANEVGQFGLQIFSPSGELKFEEYVTSPGLCSGISKVYLDANAISPAAKNSIAMRFGEFLSAPTAATAAPAAAARAAEIDSLSVPVSASGTESTASSSSPSAPASASHSLHTSAKFVADAQASFFRSVVMGTVAGVVAAFVASKVFGK
eukprot:TRINITY_DN2232_c1_g1_i3.p1 TRINITY_DN2232_c1_g1~~TRINITY_DN2232_c1_g1_i3.p1  ORF type:complete len:699 (-),score=156.68 TRINITY_DN2232_c1_g1_i3:60-2156(-)